MKRCSENIQQIYRRTPMAKCDFNKVAKQLYWNHTSAWVSSCKFTAYFQNTFFTKHLRATTSEYKDLSVTLLKRDCGTCVFLRILRKKIFAKKRNCRCSTGFEIHVSLWQVLVGKVKLWKKIQKVINFEVETSGKKIVIVFRGVFRT